MYRDLNNTTQYFARKAHAYDDTDLQSYWVLSDEILTHLIRLKLLPSDNSMHFQLLDAGGGTGRWTSNILQEYQNASAALVDITPEMLHVARKKFEKLGYIGRTTLYQSDIQNMHFLNDNSFDLAICFHNVVGFVKKPTDAIMEIARTLKPGGKIGLMIPSYYHAIYFCNATGQTKEISRIIKESKVKYNSEMPAINVFKIDETFELLRNCGFQDISFYGFPVTVYPGMEETKVHGSSEHIDSIFFNQNYRDEIAEIEKELCENSNLAARGNNILVIAEKEI